MFLLRISIVSLSLFLLVSCSHFKTDPTTLNSKLDHWLENNQFDRIDNALRNLDDSNPDYKNILKRKSSLLKSKNNYINSISSTATSLKKKHKWQDAINTYLEGLNNIDKEPRLSRELSELITERDGEVQQLRKELLLKNAGALLSYDEIYLRLQQLIPDDRTARNDIAKHQNNKRRIATHLERCGEKARLETELQLAYDCYSLSNQLQASEQKQFYVEKIDRQIKNQTNYKRYNELLSAYKSAYSNRQYNKAKMHLNTLLAINPKHKQANAYMKSLDQEINNLVTEKIELGKELYSKKKIKEALIIWKQAEEFSPDNDELLQLINRAEKVSEKIKSLEHSQ